METERGENSTKLICGEKVKFTCNEFISDNLTGTPLESKIVVTILDSND